MEIICLITFWLLALGGLDGIFDGIKIFLYIIPIAIIISIFRRVVQRNRYKKMTPEEKKKEEIKEWSRRNRC